MADSPISVDGLTPSEPIKAVAPKDAQQDSKVKSLKMLILFVTVGLYILYLLFAFGLMAILPSSEESLKPLVTIGTGTAVLAGIIFLVMGGLLLLHIAQAKVPVVSRKRALIRLVVVVIPGLIISGVMPLLIMQEPPISLDIVNPVSSQDWIAPVSMTFSLEKAKQTLAGRGFVPLQYKWDINGDGKVDQTTVVPTLVATFDREGVFTVSVTMLDAQNQTRTTARRFILSKSVFQMFPSQPIVKKPIVFSLANLIPDPATITQVQWDFDGDGKMDQTTTLPQVTYTYFNVGQYKVSALIDLKNNTQARYERTIQVQDPPALPFPVDITTEPKNLIGPSPFAVLFHVKTQTPVAQIDWDFGDGQQGQGERIAHTFKANGNYPVVARVRALSGAVAELTTAVQVVEQLSLPDLTFEGTPQLLSDTIQGEVPLTISLTPKTSTPFVTFNWEAPDATDVGSTDTKLQAIYRREGTYTVTLVAQDLNNHVLRKQITVQVRPPSALVTFALSPETGIAPLDVNFDASETSIPGDDPTGFIWNFGDGTPEITQGARISHQFLLPKTYNIELTIQTVSGKTYRATRVLSVRAPNLQACFTRSKTNVQVGSSVQFYSECSSGSAKAYLWDFGDGTQTDEQNPVHLFVKPGTFTVQLTITGDSGTTATTSTSLTVQP